jgi:hypothetical protein
VGEERPEGEHEGHQALELGDPRDGLHVRGMHEEDRATQEREPGCDPEPHEEQDQQRRREAVEHDVRHVVAAGVLSEDLPLERVQQQVNGRVVLHQWDDCSVGIQDFLHVLEARLAHVGVAPDVVLVIGNEAPTERGRIDHEHHAQEGSQDVSKGRKTRCRTRSGLGLRQRGAPHTLKAPAAAGPVPQLRESARSRPRVSP